MSAATGATPATAARQWRRTDTCGNLRGADADRIVVLQGWVHRRRDHGGLIFIDLRDRYGLTQVVFNPETSPGAHKVGSGTRPEYVLAIEGTVSPRPEGTENPNLATGAIEVLVGSVEVLSEAQTPPFYLHEEGGVDESLRLRFRYLDLRRPRMRDNLVLRYRVIKHMRDFLDARDFLDIETPIVTAATPEGARDYLVPSRLFPGQFYALPQSPQQFKQLLMVAGLDRYYQIARCFRDEDQRADRQPEFTQLDLEMSFVERDDVMALIEELYVEICEQHSQMRLANKPFRKLTYAEAMARYGSDRPDLRFELPLTEISELASATEVQVFRTVIADGGIVKALRVPGCGDYTRRRLDELVDLAKRFGAKGLVWLTVGEEDVRSPIRRFLSDGEVEELLKATEAVPGDLVLAVADQPSVANDVLARLRDEFGERLGLADPNDLVFCWIVDFPLLEWEEDGGHWTFSHNPFCSPRPGEAQWLDSDPGRAISNQYDLVLNGHEIGGGSIRIHRRALQERIFELMGHSPEQIERQFGHLLTAFEYGAPPHGGIAMGLDRLIAILAGEEAIREVIAFPKNQAAADLLMQAPGPVSKEQLDEVHIEVRLPESEDET
ncbi:MAG: aspartate--tRNA ligase [Dehalococcoidia bacterium]|nr:aspartate--tRNA ligase [Dehalococcoidia bacterium]